MMRSMLDYEGENEEVDKFANTVRKLQPGYKIGLSKQMFIEN